MTLAETLDVDLDQGWCPACSDGIEGIDRHGHGLLGGFFRRQHMIGRARLRGKAQFARVATNAHVARFDPRLEAIEVDVVEQLFIGWRHRLHRQYLGTTTASQNAVGTRVGADIQKLIALAQQVQNEGHILELHEPDIDIAGRAMHARSH